MPSVFWFRRDLRVRDNPALLESLADPGDGVVPVFVVDPHLWRRSGAARRAYLAASLRALDESLDGHLVVRRGDPVTVLPALAHEVGVSAVHVCADFGPYGARRDRAVADALESQGISLRRTGSPYAVEPGRVRTGSGSGYQVFTPFSRAWQDHGWHPPVEAPDRPRWVGARSEDVPTADPPPGMRLPPAGERAALDRWREFAERLDAYDEDRDRPGVDGTSRMSAHLKWGEVHPRTLLADLSLRRSKAAATFRTEIAWREFYADVLFRHPSSARENHRHEFDDMEYDEPAAAFEAWREGRTGYPIVDAGMRELRATGTMHNRVRMIVASFLVKDLHHHWWHGARHFMELLVDGDLASNQLNWQWVAGSGTDASPYFRVFNPLTQAAKFDPDGSYVRRWVPELGTEEYPMPVVDHAEERHEALARLERMRK